MKLQADKLTIGYGRDKVTFPEITFVADEGEVIALLGVNGIGKSTLLRTISGLQNAVKGSISIGGKQLKGLTVHERAKLISIVSTERIFVDNISVKEFVTLGRMPYTGWLGNITEKDTKEVDRIITLMKIQPLRNKLFNEVSDGEKQKVLIARALCQHTPVIVLDEPTAFLDFRSKKEILELLSSIAQDLKTTVILSTHDIEISIEYCSKCWLMTEGKTFIELKRSKNFKQEVFDVLLAGLNS